MSGKEIFKHAVDKLSYSLDEALKVSNKKITEISERVQNVKIFEDDFLYVSKKFNFGRFVLDKTFIFDYFAIKLSGSPICLIALFWRFSRESSVKSSMSP